MQFQLELIQLKNEKKRAEKAEERQRQFELQKARDQREHGERKRDKEREGAEKQRKFTLREVEN